MKESCQCELTLNSTQSLTSSILLTGDSFIYKTSHILYQSLPVFATQKLAGFAEFAQICSTTPLRNRDAFGTPYISNDFDSGAELGTFVCPGFGTFVGGFLGGLAGEYLGQKITSIAESKLFPDINSNSDVFLSK